MGMLDIILGGAGGGIFGMLGGLLKHGLEVWQETKKEQASLLILQEQNKHELLMADKQAQLMELEAKNGISLAEVTSNAAIEQAGYAALSHSYDFDKATYSNAPQNIWMVLVDVVRGLIRPTLTLYFAFLLSITTWYLYKVIPLTMYSQQQFHQETFYKLVGAIIFLATASIGWYFAARPSAKSNQQE